MSITITQGIDLTPSPFSNGLEHWSYEDGTSGSGAYDTVTTARVLGGDVDFGTCLELTKTDTIQKVRAMAPTPILPETYLRISARVKVITGNLPAVRIAAWAGDGQNNNVASVVQTGPARALTSYGDVVTVSAIVGPGLRDGVDMVWGAVPEFGHFGLDLTGPSGAVIRIEDILIEDITAGFTQQSMDTVDVRDYGAVGDGTTDNYNAFVAADQAAAGRSILVPTGRFYISQGISIGSRIRFQGTIEMPDAAPLTLTRNYDFATYVDAFASEEVAFKKAFQALLNNADHESLDLGGRTISVTEPIDLQAAVGNKNEFAIRRVIRNGQFYAQGDTAWNNTVVTSTASYSRSNPKILSNVANAANIAEGSLVTASGVGREVYVTRVNVPAQEITLSEALFDAEGTQTYSFTRFKYILDFSGFEKLSKFSLQNIELQCNSRANGVSLAKTGLTFHMKDCFITKPRYRGISSSGTGCQGMLIDRCNFVTAEGQTAAQDRVSIVLNANGNDVKLRENWASQFRHFAILSGSNNIVSNNHFYQGDGVQDGVRVAGIALTRSFSASTIVGNYVDNCFIEWTNEHDENPEFTSGFGFASLSVTGNVFMSGAVAPWFAYLVVKPYGFGHGISNLSVTGNNFRSINGTIERVERIDTSFAAIDPSKFRDIHFSGNNFNNINVRTENPAHLSHTENTAASSWRIPTQGALPFGGYAKTLQSLAPQGELKNNSNQRTYDFPSSRGQRGNAKNEIDLYWPQATKGNVGVSIRCD